MTTSAEERFTTFGPEVPAAEVPALVRSGRIVWSFGYGDDDDFTTIDESDLWAWTDDAVVVASWGPFRLDERDLVGWDYGEERFAMFGPEDAHELGDHDAESDIECSICRSLFDSTADDEYQTECPCGETYDRRYDLTHEEHDPEHPNAYKYDQDDLIGAHAYGAHKSANVDGCSACYPSLD